MSFFYFPLLLTVASTLLFAGTTTAATENAQLCGQFQAFANSDGQYIFNNNAWGEDSSGAQCTEVFDDGASFSSIWGWTANGNDTHSFPNAQLNTLLFPLAMSDLAAMNLQATWNMTPVDGATRANVVFDMFIDPDKAVSNDTVNAKYEVMIWIGAYGDPFPLGASVNPFTGVVNASLPSMELAGTTFQLFSGNNSGGQTVHTWLAVTNNTDFTADATPLITYLTNNSLVDSDTFMGILQFGSETWHSTSNITFDVSSFNMNVTSTNTSANAAASSAISGSSISTSTPTPTPTSTSISAESSSSPSTTGTPSSSISTSEISSPIPIVSTSSVATIALTSPPSVISTSLRPLSTSLIPSSTSFIPSSSTSLISSSPSTSSISTVTAIPTVPSLTPTSSGSKKSGSSIISLPFWFWEIAAAGCLFTML